METGGCLRTFDGHLGGVISVCISPDGKRALSGSSDHTIKLWDLETSTCLCTMEGHTWNILSVSFSPDGKKVLSGSQDKTMRLWDIETGKCVYIFQEFDSWVKKVCFSSDGQKIAAATETAIQVYDLDFDLHFPGWHNWDEGARPYLDIFLTLHPNWTDEDFNNILISDLQNRGYGWLRPEGVRAELEKISNKKTGFFSWFKKKYF